MKLLAVDTHGRVIQDPATIHPGRPGRSCWRSLRRHTWGDKREYFNGVHWFKVCVKCNNVRLTYHVNCSASCAFGPL